MKQGGYLKFGVLCNSHYLQHWQKLVIVRLLEAGHQLVVVIMPENRESAGNQGVKKLVKYPYQKILFRLYFRYWLKPEAKRLVDVGSLLAGARILYDKGSIIKNFYVFDHSTIEAIRQSGAHFLLRFGFGLIKGDILNVCTYGVWSFHHDDPEAIRGVPSNFWEIYHGLPVNGAILQKLSEKIDSGQILRRGWFPTILHSWEGNINQAYYGTVSWPVQVCNDIIHNADKAFQIAAHPTPGKLYLAPDNIVFLKFLLKMWYYRFRYHLKELLCAEHWVTGIAQASPEQIMNDKINSNDFIWLKNSNCNEYRADPGGWFDGKQLRIFYEYYNYCHPRGSLRTTILTQNHTPHQAEESTILNADIHLAFPFIFIDGQKVYCIPETSEKNCIELYEWDKDSGSFLFRSILIENVKAVDTIAFKHKGYWWLFFTAKDRSNYELHAWYSADLTGIYKPHVLNPVKTDIRSARPAGGIFFYKGKPIRPAQNCAPYSGKSIVLNEIEELSPSTFQENIIKELHPGWNKRFRAGMHTLNFAGPYLLADAKRHIFIPCNLKNKIQEKFRKLKTRLI